LDDSVTNDIIFRGYITYVTKTSLPLLEIIYLVIISNK